MTYTILPDGKIRLDDSYCQQTMTIDEFAAYMVPFRESDPDYYAELVAIYIRLSKSAPLP